MKFRMQTLVDITQTQSRRHQDMLRYSQQQNFLTVIQVIGLRANPQILSENNSLQDISSIGFGSKFKGKKQLWTLDFAFESEDVHSVEFLKLDFDLVPVITGLKEDAKIPKPTFLTHDSAEANVVFTRIN
jgi:hypothetical protein